MVDHELVGVLADEEFDVDARCAAVVIAYSSESRVRSTGW